MTKKIDVIEMKQMAAQGATNQEIADHFKVSKSAVSQRAKALRLNLNKSAALRDARRIANNSMSLLEQTSRLEIELQDAAAHHQAILCGDPNAIAKQKEIRSQLPRTQWQDPGAMHIKTLRELAKIIEMKKGLLESLFDLKQVQSFQQEVLSIIQEVSPDVRREIIRRLQERHALAHALQSD